MYPLGAEIPAMEEDRIGEVEEYDRASGQLLIRLEHGSIHRGETLHFKDPSLDVLQRIERLLVGARSRSEAHEGQEVLVPTEFAVPRKAQVYLVRNEFPGEEY